MDNKDKLQALQKLTEEQLRENLLIPLLGRMGYKAATVYHGPRESGKDIICFDYDKLGLRAYLGIVAKISDFTGSVSSSRGLREIVYQIEQCFNIPYENLFGMNKITMDQVWVITNGKIVSGSENSIMATLQKTNLNKLVKFISGENLVQLTDKYFISYWDIERESIEYVRGQRDRVIEFCSNLLNILGSNKTDIDSIIRQLLNSEYLPKAINKSKLSLTHLSSYSIEFDQISDKYNHSFYSWECGDLRNAFFKARKDLEYAIMEMENSIFEYDRTIEKIDPWEFLKVFEEKMADEYPFYKATVGKASDALNSIQYLEDALKDIDNLIETLESQDKLDWALVLMNSVDNLKEAVRQYLSTIESDEFTLYWQIVEEDHNEVVKFLYQDESKISEKIFSTNHTRQKTTYNRWHYIAKEITENDVIEEVHHHIRKYIDDLIGIE